MNQIGLNKLCRIALKIPAATRHKFEVHFGGGSRRGAPRLILDEVCDVLQVADPTAAPTPHAATHQTTDQQHAAAAFEKTESPPRGFLLVEMNFGI